MVCLGRFSIGSTEMMCGFSAVTQTAILRISMALGTSGEGNLRSLESDSLICEQFGGGCEQAARRALQRERNKLRGRRTVLQTPMTMNM